MADELTYSDIVEEVTTPETAPPAENVKVYLNDGNDFLQMGLEDFEDAYNISDLRDRIKKGTGGGAVVIGAITVNEASGAVSTAEGGGTKATASCAHAEGGSTTASGGASHAEGQSTVASGDESHAEGGGTRSMGTASHAEGGTTTASGSYSHAEGNITAAVGDCSHAEGGGTQASGDYSHAEGRSTFAGRKSQHVFGEFNVIENGSGATKGNYVEIVGNGTADTSRSNARTLDWQGNEVIAGKLTVGAAPTASMDVTTKQYVDALAKAESLGFAFATCPTAEATVAKVATCSNYTIAVNGFVAVKFDYAVPANATLNINSQGAHEIYHKGIAITAGVIEADDIALFVYDGSKYQLLGINRDFWDLSDRIAKGTGTNAVIEGAIEDVIRNGAVLHSKNKAGNYAHAEGTETEATGYGSHTEGTFTKATNDAAHAEGNSTTASGVKSHAEGNITTASGASAHAEGDATTASASYSHAEGYYTTASGSASHAEGYASKATGEYAHAEGQNTEASGRQSHAEGGGTLASGMQAHAEGGGCVASADFSHAEGGYTIAASSYQHVSGRYNVSDASNFYAEIVGNGSRDNSRGNARTLDWFGNEVLAGKLTVGAGPTADMDVATKKYIDDLLKEITHGSYCGVCDTAAATADKVVTPHSDYYLLHKGGIVVIRFTYDVPANATLNIDNQGAKMIIKGNGPLQGGEIVAGDTVSMMYDGSYYIIMSITQ